MSLLHDVRKLCCNPKALLELIVVIGFWCWIGQPVVAIASIFGTLVGYDIEHPEVLKSSARKRSAHPMKDGNIWNQGDDRG